MVVTRTHMTILYTSLSGTLTFGEASASCDVGTRDVSLCLVGDFRYSLDVIGLRSVWENSPEGSLSIFCVGFQLLILFLEVSQQGWVQPMAKVLSRCIRFSPCSQKAVATLCWTIVGFSLPRCVIFLLNSQWRVWKCILRLQVPSSVVNTIYGMAKTRDIMKVLNRECDKIG